jgi:glycerophosphoryl diester phosphodiesterase
LAELRQADAGAWFTADGGRTFPFRAAGVFVPTLSEVLRAFPEMPVLLEIKESGAQEAVRHVLLEERAVDRCVLASDDLLALAAFGSPFSRAASRQEISALYWGTLLRRIRAAPSPGASPSYRLLSVPARYRGLPVPTVPFVSAARRSGCPVHVWTVNDAGQARRLWNAGVAGIVTNFPDSIARARPLLRRAQGDT